MLKKKWPGQSQKQGGMPAVYHVDNVLTLNSVSKLASGPKWQHKWTLNSSTPKDSANLQLYIRQFTLKDSQKLAEKYRVSKQENTHMETGLGTPPTIWNNKE